MVGRVDGTYNAYDDIWNQAIRAAASRARNSCLVPPDGGSPTPTEVEHADRAAAEVLMLIKPEKESTGIRASDGRPDDPYNGQKPV